MKNKVEVSEKMNAEINRYRDPNSIRWKFVDDDVLSINKQYGLMTQKHQRMEKLDKHLRSLSNTIMKKQSSIVLPDASIRYQRDFSPSKDDIEVHAFNANKFDQIKEVVDRNKTPMNETHALPKLNHSVDKTAIRPKPLQLAKCDKFDFKETEGSFNASPTIRMDTISKTNHVHTGRRNAKNQYSSIMGNPENIKNLKLGKRLRLNKSPELMSIFTAPPMFPDLNISKDLKPKKQVNFSVFDSRHVTQPELFPEEQAKKLSKTREKLRKQVEQKIKQLKQEKVSNTKRPTFVTGHEAHQEDEEEFR